MSNKVLFVFEGEKTEHQLNSSLQKNVLNMANIVIECVFCSDIYQLYKQIKKDEFTDIFTLLKNRDNTSLNQFSKDDFGEIYLFFDYDGHAPNSSDNKVVNLLRFFDNETENGKLFVSYPMIEAIKHISIDNSTFKDTCVCCNKNINYKSLVNEQCDSCYKDFRHYSFLTWQTILRLHLSKANFIVNNLFELPSELIPQNIIFDNQINKYINPLSLVSVLSAFPMFVHDYFGNKRTLEIIKN